MKFFQIFVVGIGKKGKLKMNDLNQLIEEISELPNQIYKAALLAAQSQSNYEMLREEIKHKRAAIVNCYNEKSQAKAETMAYGSSEYKKMLDELSEARLESLKHAAYHDYLLKKYDSNKTQQIAIMSQMKLV